MIVLFRLVFTLCLFLAACGDKEREIQRARYNEWTKQLQIQDVFSPDQISGIWVLDKLVTLYSDPYDHQHDSALHKDYTDNSVFLLFSEGKYVRSILQNSCPNSSDWLVELGAREAPPEPPAALKWSVNSGLTPDALLKAATALKPEKFTPFELERDLLKTPFAFRENRKRETFEETHIFKLHEVEGKKTLELAHVNTSLTSGIHTVVERYHALSESELRARFEERIKANYPCPK